jgi:hypothetical protein
LTKISGIDFDSQDLISLIHFEKRKGASIETPFLRGYAYESKDGTFRAVFRLEMVAKRRKERERKPIRIYRNPILLAREWAEAMHPGNFRSRRAFAKAIGVSHARVSQVLGLLRLYPQAVKQIEALGDPLSSRAVTERKLRPFLSLPLEKQIDKVRTILTSRHA